MALTNEELTAAIEAAEQWPKGRGRAWAVKPGRPSNYDVTAQNMAVEAVQQDGYQP